MFLKHFNHLLPSKPPFIIPLLLCYLHNLSSDHMQSNSIHMTMLFYVLEPAVMVSLHSRNTDIRELRDTVVNRLQVHPGGQRVLVHARDSQLRMLDIATASVIQWFNGVLNHSYGIKFCIVVLYGHQRCGISQLREKRKYWDLHLFCTLILLE